MRSSAALADPVCMRWAIVAGSLATAGDAAAQTVTVPFAELTGHAIPIPPWAIVLLAVAVAAAGAIALRERLAASIERVRGAPLAALLLALIVGAGTSGAWIPRVLAVVGATSFDLQLPGPTVSPVLAVGVDITVHNATGVPVTLGTPTVSVPYALSPPSASPQCAAGLVLPALGDCYLKVVLPTAPTNQAPQVSAGGNQNRVLGQPVLLSGSATDDGRPLSPGTLSATWSLVAGPLPVSFANANSPATSATFYTPGTYTLRLSAFDGELTATSDTEVTVATAAPVMRPIADRTIPLGTRFRVALSASDGDALGTLAFSLPTAPSGATLAPSPLVDWTPTAAQLGQNTFTARVVNGSGQSAQTSFKVTVTAANRPPVLAAQPDATVPVGTLFARTLTATDPDAGDILTFSLQSGPAGMSLAGANLSWPTSGVAPGNYSVTVRVADSAGALDAALFVISVVPASLPRANDDHYSIGVGQTLAIPTSGVLGNDFGPDGAPSANKLSDPAIGTLQSFNADGSFTYQAPSATSLGLLDPVVDGYFGPNGSVNLGSYPPLVADLDGDGKPELIMWDQDQLHAITVATGATLFTAVGLPPPFDGCATYGRGFSRFAVADIDDSGLPSIVMGAQCAADSASYIYAADAATRVIAIAYDPSPANASHWKVKWISAPFAPQVPAIPGDGHLYVPYGGSTAYVAFTVARLNPADKPTILFGRTTGGTDCGYLVPGKTDPWCRIVFALDGQTGALKTPYYSAPAQPASVDHYSHHAAGSYPAPIVGDFDASGTASIIYEGTWWAVDGTVKRQIDGTAATGPATHDSVVADLDGDGKVELIAMDAVGRFRMGAIKAWTLDGTLLWSFPIPLDLVVSKMTVADLDRDGKPDILFGRRQTLYALDATGAVKWMRSLPTSGFDFVDPGPDNDYPVYDLDGDGVPEIVVQIGKNTLHFLRGDTGETQAVWQYPGTSVGNGQSVKTPIVADLMGDGHARVGFYHDVNLNFSNFFVVLKSNNVPWQKAPAHLNQRAYWETNFVVDATHNNTVPLTYARQQDDPRTNVFGVHPQAPYVVPPKEKTQASFTYEAASAGATSAPATVTIDITPLNRPPKFTSRPPWRCDDSINFQSYQLTGSDPDPGDTITFTVEYSDLPYFEFNAATGVINFRCGTIYGSEPRATLVIVTDSHGASAYQTFTTVASVARTPVPDVVGDAKTTAAATLVGAQLVVGGVTELANSAPAGEVLAQFPAAGASVLVGEHVDLVVSKGPPPAPVPDVVGKSEGAAGSALAAGGFTIDTLRAYSNTVPVGTVMQQSPAAGTLLEPIPANAVTLTISAGTGLALRLDSAALQAGGSLALHTVAIALDGTEAPFLAVNYAISGAAGASGTPPGINGTTMTTSATTRGGYVVTATEIGGSGRTAKAEVVVLPPDPSASNAYWSRFRRFGEALAMYLNAAPALERATQASDKAAILALVQPIRATLAQADLKTLATADPWAVETGFLPTAAEVTAAGFSRTAEDQLFIATSRELATTLARIARAMDPDDGSSLQELMADLAQAQNLATLLDSANPTIAGLAGAHPSMAAIGAGLLPQALDGWLATLADRASKSAKAPPKVTLPQVLVGAVILVASMGAAVYHVVNFGNGPAYKNLLLVQGLIKDSYTVNDIPTETINTGQKEPLYLAAPTYIDVAGIPYEDGKPAANFTAIALSSADQPAVDTIFAAFPGQGTAVLNGPALHGVFAQALAQIANNPPGGSRDWENRADEAWNCGAGNDCASLAFNSGLVAHKPCTSVFPGELGRFLCVETTILVVWDQTRGFAVSGKFGMWPAKPPSP